MSNCIIAKCYLLEEGDERNVCYLSEETLTIIFKSKKEIFFTHWIRTISFKKKKFLIPIVFGGITASLAGLGLFQYYLNPWVMLSTVFGASLLIYYGAMGGIALTIETPIKEYDFFIKKMTPNLNSFVAFSNTLIQGDSIKFYVSLSKEIVDEAKFSGELKVPEEGLTLTTKKPSIKAEECLLSFNSKDLPIEVKYVQKGNELTPTIFKNIPIDLLTDCQG